jgi:hypothetical protein
MISAYGCWNLDYPASVHRDVRLDEILTVRDEVDHSVK